MALGRPGQTGYPEVAGDIAQGAADTTTSYPVKLGGTCIEWNNSIDSINNQSGDRVSAILTPQGRQWVEIGHPNFFQTTVALGEPTTGHILIDNPGSGTALAITDLVFGSDTIGVFSFGQAPVSTPIYRMLDLRTRPGESASITFRQPLILSNNIDFLVTTDSSKTSIYVAGYKTPIPV